MSSLRGFIVVETIIVVKRYIVVKSTIVVVSNITVYIYIIYLLPPPPSFILSVCIYLSRVES